MVAALLVWGRMPAGVVIDIFPRESYDGGMCNLHPQKGTKESPEGCRL